MRPSLLLAALLTSSAAIAAEPVTLTIKTLASQMRYDLSELNVEPGAAVKLIFENVDDMPHNIVFFQPGTDVVAACAKQMEKPEEALKRDWIPLDPQMWLHSKLVANHQKEELVFKAPDKAGVYPFCCTFPGHALAMQGKLNVLHKGPILSKLQFHVYLGDWQKLPDFAALKAHREGEIADNLIDLKFDDYKNQFGVVYTAKFNAAKAGEYTFAIASDDGSRILIDGKKVIDFDGVHSTKEVREGKTQLSAGEHDFRLEYFQGSGEAGLSVAWQGPDFGLTPLSKSVHPHWLGPKEAKKKDDHSGMPLVVTTEPIIYRNFISGAGTRTIAVGYPGGVNIAWDADRMNLALLWRGAFIDAARHWVDRGGGFQPPLGFDVLRPSAETAPALAIVTAGNEQWPALQRGQRAENTQSKGYELDAKRVPTFSYLWNGVKVSERFEVDGNAAPGSETLIRWITLTGKIPAAATFLAAMGDAIEPVAGAFSVKAAPFKIESAEYPNAFTVAVEGGTVAGKNLVVPARPQIKITYSWPGTKRPNPQAK